MKTFNVYFLYDIFNNLLYVGKTKSLRTRFHGHFNRTMIEKEPWKNEVDTDNIIIYNCLNDCDMDIYETYFINKYHPKHNKDKVFESTSSFELPYLEPIQYSFDSKRPKGFQKSFLEYMNLREDIEEDNQELIESYEAENLLFKEAYEKLGRKIVNSCKFHEQSIRDKLNDISSNLINSVKQLLDSKYQSGDIVLIKDLKIELQKIYDELGIKSKAKGSDVTKYIKVKLSERRINGNSCLIAKF